MISTLDPAKQDFVNSLNSISQRMSRAQQQLSTGYRMNTVSDYPDQVSPLLQARADLDRTQQIQTNLGRVKTEVDAGEQAMEQTVSLMEQARSIGAQGANSISTADSRSQLADQLGAILQNLVGLSNTTVDGRFIFSGDSDQQAAYSIDLTQANPVSAYQGSDSTRQVQHPNGTRFSVSKTAQQIFDSPNASENIFVSVNSLRVALQNNDQAAINAALKDVTTAGTYANAQLAYYGNVQNSIANATDFGQKLQTQLQTEISSLQDADETQAIVELNQAAIQQQAALQSQARMPQTTLFDYLPSS
jgi:flagellar hook-associated protein 3 FlgL